MKKHINNIALSAAFAVASVGLAFGIARYGVNPLMTDKDGAELIVKNKYPKWSDVKATGYGWLDCPISSSHRSYNIQDRVKGDIWRTRFSAKNENGEPVNGVVCEGLLSEPEILANN